MLKKIFILSKISTLSTKSPWLARVANQMLNAIFKQYLRVRTIFWGAEVIALVFVRPREAKEGRQIRRAK
jgi:hypothetical protein